MRRTLIVAAALAALAACSGDGGPGPGAAACGATGEAISPFGDHASVVVGDVTGDAADDAVTVASAGEGAYRLDVAGAATIALPDSEAFLVVAGAADLDADGRADLVLGFPWQNRVLVFRAPLAGALTTADAALTIHGPPRDGGLAPLYGAAVLVTDVDADGDRDVVVSAPAEREEGCLGQLAPRVHLGPFARGATVTEAEVDLLLDGPPRACLGEALACTAGGLEVSAVGGPTCYAFPLASPAPSACPG